MSQRELIPRTPLSSRISNTQSASQEALFRVRTLQILSVLLLLNCFACARVLQPKETIFCAASLGNFIKDLDLGDVSTQLGGSRTLLLQIQAGAKPDLVLLADDLASELKGPGEMKIKMFATNSLVLVTPTDRTDWPGLRSAQSRLAVADPKSAPLGRYTQQFLAQQEIRAQLVSLKDATAVAAAVRLGHVDAGVIYRSDLHGDSKLVEAVLISPTNHDPIRYQAVLFEPAPPRARALFDWLSSEEAQGSLKAAGFDT